MFRGSRQYYGSLNAETEKNTRRDADDLRLLNSVIECDRHTLILELRQRSVTLALERPQDQQNNIDE